MQRLTELPVLAIDCQSTGASPKHGHLLEIAWCRSCAADAGTTDANSAEVASFVLELPDDEKIPRRVQRMTGIDAAALADAVPPPDVWAALRAEAAKTPHSVIHYARFEQAFLDDAHQRLSPDEAFPLDIVCTHAIAGRLFSDLPRRGLRALAGYLGYTLPEQKRAADHALATAWIWRQLVRELRLRAGVETLDELRVWLGETSATRGTGKDYALSRDVRLALPTSPGVYRMLSKGGDVLYVGKATSLKTRVNAYFQSRRSLAERKLELVTQVWDVDVTCTATPLEAALLETDEIKRHSPAYNRALRTKHRRVQFASADWTNFSDTVDAAHPVGPLRSSRSLRLASALVDSAPVAQWLVDEAPEYLAGAADFLEAGAEIFFARHGLGELDVIALELWKAHQAETGLEEDSEADEEPQEFIWTPDTVADTLEAALRRAHRACRRARLLCMLTDATIAFRPKVEGCDGRMLVVEAGEVVEARDWADEALDVPPGHARLMEERKALFDLATWDRLRVLSTELRRLVSEGCELRVRLGPHATLERDDLATLFEWL
jgi:DNA polymerase-3 subunit epsilon